MALRVGVLASGSGTNLEALLGTVHGHEAQIVAVASDKPEAPRAAARRAGLRSHARVRALGVCDARGPRRRRSPTGWTNARCELVVLAGYMQLLGAAFLRRFPDAVINVHPALLPAFPGIAAIAQAVAYGVKVFGVTVHFVDEGVDTGAIILQAAIELPPAPTDPEAVHDALRPLEHRLLPEAVRLFARGALRRDPANPRRVLVDLP